MCQTIHTAKLSKGSGLYLEHLEKLDILKIFYALKKLQ